jgi:uroporphyrinogen decarboxylase
MKDPKFVHALARVATDWILELVDMAVELGADIIALDGDLAFSQTTLMSPAQYEEYVFPYHREITERVHRLGKLIFKHTDGNAWPIMDGIAAAGFDGFHPVQPQCMDIGEVKAKYKERLCILGNIDCTYLLPFGSEEEVEQSVMETIDAAAPGGGYIISSSNSIHPGCRPENYIAMVRAARKYGDYPIRIEG